MIKFLTLLSILLLLYFPAEARWHKTDCEAERQQVKLYKIPADIRPVYVIYDKYAYSSSVLDYAVVDTFVIGEFDRREQLEAYKPKTVQMPLISAMVIEKGDDSKSSSTMLVGEGVSEYTVYFGFDKYRVEKKQKEILDKISLKGGETVDIFGYACVIGPKSYNQKLSQRRAEEVAKYLRKREVPVGAVVGMGETSQEREFEKNRKVVIKITTQK